jgi:hypothetical protein
LFIVATVLPAGAAPKEYKVFVHYRIRAGANQRLIQFRQMVSYFESIGFKKDAGAEGEEVDPDQTLMTGTIASDNVRKLLIDPHVRSLLLLPPDYQLPTGDQDLVLVRLELRPTSDVQIDRRMAEQLSRLLEGFGFRQNIGYDNRAHTQILGTLPATKVRLLLEDLRSQATGWIVPSTSLTELPSPLKEHWPLVVTEVIPVPSGTPVRTEVPAVPAVPKGDEKLLKVSHELRNLANQDAPVRIEVVLADVPGYDDQSWQRVLLTSAPGIGLEGRLGQLVTLRATPQQAIALADVPSVITLRLPRPATSQAASTVSLPRPDSQLPAGAKPDRAMRNARPNSPRRVVVISDDFTGYEKAIGKQLPAETRLVDLASECDPNVEPAVAPKTGGGGGQGTQTAIAVTKAMPGIRLTLLRIDRDAPYQLAAVVRYINGDPVSSISLDRRRQELIDDSNHLRTAREELLKERQALFANPSADDKWLARQREYFSKQAALDKAEEAHQQRDARFLQLSSDLIDLTGTSVVVCGLVWNDGYPAAASSMLSHYLDDQAFRTLWLQTDKGASAAAWRGYFRDTDGNGVMEFAAPGTPMSPGKWTTELNFLGWQPPDGGAAAELPKSKLRISIQWREPHDPTLWNPAQDLYRAPLANLKLTVLHQRDPSGASLPADDLEVVAQSADLPLRLMNQPSFAVYEQTLDFDVPSAGRYALRVEGSYPPHTRPSNEPTLPIMQQHWELWPRIYVSRLDADEATAGKPVFADFANPDAAIGMPADAHQLKRVSR